MNYLLDNGRVIPVKDEDKVVINGSMTFGIDIELGDYIMITEIKDGKSNSENYKIIAVAR